MQALLALLDYIPYKREISAGLAFIVVVLQAWNSFVPEIGHGPCLATPDQIADALNAAKTCATDWSLKIPETVNAFIMALLGAGVAAGKQKDKAAIMDGIKDSAKTSEQIKTEKAG